MGARAPASPIIYGDVLQSTSQGNSDGAVEVSNTVTALEKTTLLGTTTANAAGVLIFVTGVPGPGVRSFKKTDILTRSNPVDLMRRRSSPANGEYQGGLFGTVQQNIIFAGVMAVATRSAAIMPFTAGTSNEGVL